jgi:hypothetical protein
MKKALLLLALGVVVGYWIGFRDAKVYEDNIVERLVHRTGGSHRALFKANNVDSRLDSITQ